MMNFYEEFGVPNDASVEEIRQAYKTLARVLHPDNQPDEKLRAAAACQMKRLHEVLDTLLDPQRRRAYDESLAAAAYSNAAALHWASHASNQPSVRPLGEFGLAESALRHWSWILIACMILGSGYWYLTARVPATAESAPNGFAVASPPSATGRPALRPIEEAAKHEIADPAGRSRLSSSGRAVLPESPSAAKPELPGLPDIPAPQAAAFFGLPPAAAYSAGAPEVREPETAPSVANVGKSSFAGDWFYAPAVEKPDPRLYPPVDIEFQLTEQDGILDGQYRGRYKIPDAAVSQDVVFQVQGKSSARASAALVWTSGDGAHGEIDLNLLQPNLMRVTWWATQLGRQPGLSSGAATLYRQQTP
jgi:curved DNA-binding protein CbpA